MVLDAASRSSNWISIAEQEVRIILAILFKMLRGFCFRAIKNLANQHCCSECLHSGHNDKMLRGFCFRASNMCSGSFLPGQCSEHWLGACRHYLWIAGSFDIWSNVQSLTPYSFQVNLCGREHTDIKSYWLGSRTRKPSKMTAAAALTTTCLLLRRRLFLTKEAMRARVQQDSAGVGGRRRASPFGPRAGAWSAYPPPGARDRSSLSC